jgi:peptidyl-tRNA hydrolase
MDAVAFAFAGASSVAALADAFQHDAALQSKVRSLELSFAQSADGGSFGNLGFGRYDIWDSHSARRRDKTTNAGVLFPHVAATCMLPQTFMNLSGSAVLSFVRRSGLQQHRLQQDQDHNHEASAGGGSGSSSSLVDSILVCVDDINLPFGKLKLTFKGGDGGHNGIKDITSKLGTDQYTRLRIGVGHHKPGEVMSSFVLGQWSKEESVGGRLDSLYCLVGEVVRVFAHRGGEAAQMVANNIDLDAYEKASATAAAASCYEK